MDVEERIIQALKNGGPRLASVSPNQLESLQEGVFHLHTDPPYFLKWIPEDDHRGNNELRVNQVVLSKANIPVPRLIFMIKLAGATLAGWEWLEGTDLRYRHREWLPQAFAALAGFHAEQRHAGRVESLITHCVFDTVRQLLESELAFLCAGLEEAVRQKAVEAFNLLEAGYPTRVHGDAHPGNIHLTGAGLTFVDWGYSASSLNLFDLGYIQTIHLPPHGEADWWCITPDEARPVLNSYYKACGIKNPDIDRLQWAVMFWSLLWERYNCLKQGNPPEIEAVRLRINELIAAG